MSTSSFADGWLGRLARRLAPTREGLARSARWRLVPPWLSAALLAGTLGLHAAGTLTLQPVRELDALWHDLRLKAFAETTAGSRVVIIDIDEASLAAVGRWPWGRDRLAELVSRLFEQQQVNLVGLDLILSEPDRGAGLDTLQALAEGPLRDNPGFQREWMARRDALDHDGRLAAVMQRHPVVLGFQAIGGAEASGRGQLPPPALPQPGEAAASLAEFNAYGASLPRLAAAARGGGFLNSWVDHDGVRRRAPLLARVDGQVQASLALAMLLAQQPAGGQRSLTSRPDGSMRLQFSSLHGPRQLMADEQGSILLPYASPSGLVRQVSAFEVLSGVLPPGSLRGQLALIGTTVAGLGDRHPTPVSAHLPGVQAHATLLHALMHGQPQYQPAWARPAQLGLLMLLAVSLPFMLWRCSLAAAAAVCLGLLLLLSTANAWAWVAQSWALPWAVPTLWVLGMLVWRLVHGHARERRERRRLEGLFGQYVPPELVARMSRHPGQHDMQGRSAELTVLFADLHGFTRLSETLPPPELVRLVNEFFSEMTDIVREHGGTLDKYIGDSVMAFWGAPLDDPDHAQHALHAAEAMQGRLPAMNARFAARGWPALSLGIGINSGTVIVGDLGSRHRRAYTVLGDAVNVAARLQGLTRRLGTAILIGEGSQRLLPEGRCRWMSTQRLRGRTGLVKVYAPARP
ncbi:MAG: adenylate/guanylate cyclase domain-containing protein [Rubrivivax sp.]|nr:adenylate/guanylate cyclase domain-containing protein [Rubrivivax sp.]